MNGAEAPEKVAEFTAKEFASLVRRRISRDAAEDTMFLPTTSSNEALKLRDSVREATLRLSRQTKQLQLGGRSKQPFAKAGISHLFGAKGSFQLSTSFSYINFREPTSNTKQCGR